MIRHTTLSMPLFEKKKKKMAEDTMEYANVSNMAVMRWNEGQSESVPMLRI